MMTNHSPRSKALTAIREMIENGTLAPGAMLPPERSLAIRLDVSLSTLQRALLLLEAEGLVVRRGARTRLVAKAASKDEELLAGTVLVVAENNHPVNDPTVYGWAGYVASGSLSEILQLKLHAVVLNPDELADDRLDRLLASGVSGFILPELDRFETHFPGWAKHAVDAKVPVVVFGDEEPLRGFDRVAPDHETGAYALTQWLLSTGRKAPHLVAMSDQPPAWMQARRRGYEKAMREAGRDPFPSLLLPSLSSEETSEDKRLQIKTQIMAGALLHLNHDNIPVDALLATTDGDLPAIAAAVKLLGKTPNADIALVGYDDYWDQAPDRSIDDTPPLATINKNNLDIGRELVRLLLDRRNGNLPPEPQLRLVAPTLKVRKTN